jgi:hypothetical protein
MRAAAVSEYATVTVPVAVPAMRGLRSTSSYGAAETSLNAPTAGRASPASMLHRRPVSEVGTGSVQVASTAVPVPVHSATGAPAASVTATRHGDADDRRAVNRIGSKPAFGSMSAGPTTGS